MAKKNNSVSINALEKYCDSKTVKTITCSMPYHGGEDELVFEVKNRLGLEDAMRFVEDVVRECMMESDLIYVPIARTYMIGRNTLTYYANFTMPKDSKKAYELVLASADIIEKIKSVIDENQYMDIVSAINERICFETDKMLSLQTAKVDGVVNEVGDFIKKIEGMFGGVSGDQMADFITSMSKLSQADEISTKDLANALVAGARNKDEE